MPSRRQFLGGLAGAAVAGLAGCTGQANRVTYATDVRPATDFDGVRAVVSGTYGRDGGWASGGKAAYAKLRITVRPSDTDETFTDTVEIYFRPPGTEGEFESVMRLSGVTAEQVEAGEVEVEVAEVKDKITFGEGAD